MKRGFRYEYYAGIKTDSLEILEYSHGDGTHSYWKCLCLYCGKTFLSQQRRVLTRKGCGCKNVAAFKDITNQVFGNLLVVKYLFTNKFSHRVWECLCECGNTAKVEYRNLSVGRTKSCGCLADETRRLKRKPNSLAAKTTVYGSYKKQAKKKNVPFELPFDIFVEMISKKCSYCGVEPLNNRKDRGGKYFRYNGIDRIIPEKGYVISNVCTCCIICNRSKNSLSKEAFMEWIKRVYSFNFK